MALQTEVTGPVITSAGVQYRNKLVNAEFTLKCWPEGVDTKTAEPVINKKFNCQQKTVIDDKALSELPASVTEASEKQMAKEMNEVISDYNYAKQVEIEAKITSMASNIQEVING